MGQFIKPSPTCSRVKAWELNEGYAMTPKSTRLATDPAKWSEETEKWAYRFRRP